MRFQRYSQSFAMGAAGLLTGLLYPNVSNYRQFLISAADCVNMDIDAIISNRVDVFIKRFAPSMKYGLPSHDTLRLKDNFILSYDRRNRVPNWVMEHLTSSTIKGDECVKRKRCKFFEDLTIHDYFRATKNDYKNSGYDKGHLAAAANHKQCKRTYDETFVLSNITPQNKYFNQRIWHDLERHVRNLVERYGSVYVCSGPLYLPREISLEEEEFFISEDEKRMRRKKQVHENPNLRKMKKYVIYEVIGENNVAVPTHFFKIILCEAENNKFDLEAYIIPNEYGDARKPLSDYMVKPDTIERAAGLLLFPQLPKKTLRCMNGRALKDGKSMKDS